MMEDLKRDWEQKWRENEILMKKEKEKEML